MFTVDVKQQCNNNKSYTGRHFHAPITVNLVRFNGKYLVPLIRKSLGLKRPSLCNKAHFPRTDVISLYHMPSFREMKPFIWMLKKTYHDIIFGKCPDK